MTVREFRKLMHGVDADAELVFRFVDAPRLRHAVIPCELSVTESNATADGETAVKSVFINLRITEVGNE